MALSCPIGFDTKQLRDEVSEMYSRVASDPSSDFHFHRGPAYAAEWLGYGAARLAALPERSTACFAGIANPLAVAPLRPGERVLDVGCGAGMDLLLAAQDVGPTGLAIGVDMTPAMLECVAASAKEMAELSIELKEGDAEELPVGDESVDVVISNGVISLTTDKTRAFSEIARVLVPGGRLMLGDIVVKDELSEDIRNDVDLWAAWIGGALPEAELVEILGRVGFEDVRVTHRYNSFRGTSKENVAGKFGVAGINVFGRKGARARSRRVIG